jgi:hypothetical protein
MFFHFKLLNIVAGKFLPILFQGLITKGNSTPLEGLRCGSSPLLFLCCFISEYINFAATILVRASCKFFIP